MKEQTKRTEQKPTPRGRPQLSPRSPQPATRTIAIVRSPQRTDPVATAPASAISPFQTRHQNGSKGTIIFQSNAAVRCSPVVLIVVEVLPSLGFHIRLLRPHSSASFAHPRRNQAATRKPHRRECHRLGSGDEGHFGDGRNFTAAENARMARAKASAQARQQPR